MSASKQDIYEKLIEDYETPRPSLKEQAINAVAIQLCQNSGLKKYIIFTTKQLQRHKYVFKKSMWDILLEEHSTNMCHKLPLPSRFKNILIVRIRSIALQLFIWNKQQVMFKLSPLFADSLLYPSDWTVEMRLDEKKIAERLVKDEGIPVDKRYRIACFYYLDLIIPSLWNQISPEHREDLLRNQESKIVQLWSYKLAGKVENLIPNEDLFWFSLWKHGIIEASKSTVFHCWGELHMNLRQEHLLEAAEGAAICTYDGIKNDFLMWFYPLPAPVPYNDILCFLLAQMTKEQRTIFFQTSLRVTHINILICFLQWPYMDLLLPIIKELWNILPETKYEELLICLAASHSDKPTSYYSDKSYADYEYGSLLEELLKETPDHFKRYMFGDKKGELLNVVIKEKSDDVFQHIWQQYVTLKEKRSFLRSKYGEFFCCHLAKKDNWDLLNSVVRECFPEDKVAMFRKQILRSKSGKISCIQMLMNVNEKCLKLWLNWGFSTKEEIFSYIFKILFRSRRTDFKRVCGCDIKIDFLDNVIKMYSPSEEARRKFKTRFVKLYSRFVCIHFVIQSQWRELDQFLSCVFQSKRTRKRFKNWFVREYAMDLCEYLIERLNFEDADQFLEWCFASIEAVEQFRQELFFFAGIMYQWSFFRRNLEDFDSLIRWFRLSPEEILKFKKEVFFRSYSLSDIFTHLSILEKYVNQTELVDCDLKNVARFLKWGLTSQETLMAFKDASKIYLADFSFGSDEVRRWVQQNWDKLISEVLFDLLIGRKYQA